MMRPTPLPRSALLAIGFGLLLGGCQTAPNRGVESVHQPVVSRSDFVFDVREAGPGLAPGEAGRLRGWFESLGLRYGDRVALDGRGMSSGITTAEVAEAAAGYGLLLAPTAPLTAGEVPAGHVRVVVSRMTASVPGCPDWKGANKPDYVGGTTPNYGCAAALNLAAMIADPEDLVHGREPSTTIDVGASGKAIRAYRDRPVSGAGALQSAGGAGGGASGGSN